jgi:hypothetical protein
MGISSEFEPRSAIEIEETYTYDFELGAFTQITCTSAAGRLKVTVPYDGRLLADTSPDANLELGGLSLSAPGLKVDPEKFSVRLPIGADLADLLRSGREAVWDWSYTPPIPQDTLLAIEASVIDGAALDLAMNEDQLTDLLFGSTDTFVSDLRLHLDLWVPRQTASVLTGSRGQELRRLLLEQESDIQIFLPPGASASQIAESLAALANGSGGRLLIGIRYPDQVIGIEDNLEALRIRMLQAALTCAPPVVFAPPDLLEGESGEKVARVAVPPSQIGPHFVDGKRPVRRGTKTVSEVVAVAASRGTEAALPPPISDLRGMMGGGGGADMIILGGKGVELTADDLGRSICALVNSIIGHGMIVVRNLTAPRRWFFGNQGKSANQSFEQILDQALNGIAPRIIRPRPEFATVDGEYIAMLRIKGHRATVATFRGAAYEWTGAATRAIELADLYQRYMTRTGQQLRQGASGDPVTLSFGELLWPLQPPGVLKLAVDQQVAYDRSLASFDEQRKAMVWHNRRFLERKGTNGAVCSLAARLRQAFLEVSGGPDSNPQNVLTGTLVIRLDNKLASGLECLVEDAHELLHGIPVYKRTYLVAQVKIYATELFQRRRRVSLLHFQIPDVSLGVDPSERIVDLQQVCADLGFWVSKASFPPSPNDTRVLLRGVRSANHYDINLTLGFRYSTTRVTRELRFEQRVDSKQLETGYLDARIVLSGTGKGAEEKLTQLQLELGQLIHERLHYLRTE